MIEIAGAPYGGVNGLNATQAAMNNKQKLLKFNVEVGSSVIDDTDRRAIPWKHKKADVRNMYDSLQDFKTDINK